MQSASEAFPPDPAEAWRRVANIRVRDYAATRNALDGAVTRLSPYITHGLIDVPDVVAALRERHADRDMLKLLQELAWREYFQHVWRHLGEGIHTDIRPGLPCEYSHSMPADVLEARTGVPVIDASVRALYVQGWLHNHARMWLASYVVHLRKVHWRAGAEWMLARLLDGDPASNHLSWQWCAGTFSTKPYLFNAENVARYAPTLASPGTVIDTSYEALEAIVRSGKMYGAEVDAPTTGLVMTQTSPAPAELTSAWPLAQDESASLVHPWDLGERSRQGRVIGVIHRPYHDATRWSHQRWDFVLSRMRALCEVIWCGDLADVVRIHRGALHARLTLHAGYREALIAIQASPVPRFTPDPERLQPSFSAFWRGVEREIISR